LHITNCYNEEELSKRATVKESLTVQHEWSLRQKRRNTNHETIDHEYSQSK